MKYYLGLLLLFCSSAYALRSVNFPEITNGNMGNSTITGTPIYLDQMNMMSVQAIWTGTPVGTFDVQVSDDNGIGTDGTGVVNWTDVLGSQYPAGGSSGNFAWNLSGIGYKWARIFYLKTSGTGTVNARGNNKGL